MDFEEIKAEFGEDLLTLFQVFEQENDISVQQLLNAHEAGDIESVSMLAHKMKGTFRIFKANELELLAAKIEKHSEQPGVKDYIYRLEKSYRKFIAEMKDGLS